MIDDKKITFFQGVLTLLTVSLLLHAILYLADWRNQGALFWTFYLTGHFVFFWFVSGMVGIIIASLGFNRFYTEHDEWFTESSTWSPCRRI